MQVFNCVLGLTKPLSDTLQAKQLNLATAIDLVDSTCKALKERRSEKYFEDEVWKLSESLAENMNIYVTTPCARKRLSRPPKALQERVIMTPIGARVAEENVASCNPKDDHFFHLDHVQPMAEESGIDLIKLAPQLDIARNLLRSKGVESMEDIMKELLPLQHGFPEVYHLIKVAMTIPVTSATEERSFSVLKRIKRHI